MPRATRLDTRKGHVLAITPVGNFTRKTERVYTHVILAGPETLGMIERRLAGHLASIADSKAYHEKCLANGTDRIVTNEDGVSVVESVEQPSAVTGGRVWRIREVPDYSAMELSARARSAEALKVRESGVWFEMGWAGRADLAEKQVAKIRADYPGREVRAYPVTSEGR